MHLLHALLVALLLAAPAAAAPATEAPPAAPVSPIGTERIFGFPSGPATARVVALALDEVPIRVWLPAVVDEEKAAELMATLEGHLAQLPPEHRAVLKTVAFDPGEYPGNAKKARQLQSPELKLWASAKAGVIVFYRNTPPGDWRVSRRRVFHEMGHCLAHARFGTSTPPADWTAAARGDDAFFSDYSRNAFEATGTLVEDFADAYAAYMQAIADGGDAPARFRDQYPARARLLDVYTGQATPATF